MPVVGTAGHVDHGKSTLTMALSGRDPDRWAVEKERGLTIDLGFAWTRIDDIEVSFVDVPGHERYSKNMLAGIESIDVALLVVAADEGWMPQSEEHLAVLDLLGVERAVVALTKSDRVDPDLLELAGLEVEEKVAGTSLVGSPIVAVSATTGDGLVGLRHALADALRTLPVLDTDRPRLWIDRAFSASGAGTVVTGTLLGGPIAAGDRLRLFPAGVDCRVRGIQSHEQVLSEVEPRRRVALNLAGVDTAVIDRGSMIGRADDWRMSNRFAVEFKVARYVEQITNRGAYHLHLGSGAWPARIRLLDDTHAIVDLESALPVAMGDRFVLRDTGRRLVVAGGRILDPAPPRSGRIRPHLPTLRGSLPGSPDDRATALLQARGRELVSFLHLDSGGGHARDAVKAGEWVLTADTAAGLTEHLRRIVDEYHHRHPLRPGAPTAEVASRIGLDAEVVAALVGASGDMDVDGSHIRATSFAGVRSEAQEAAWMQARATLLDAGAGAVPRVDELGIGSELVHSLVRDGSLVRIADDLVMLPEQVDGLVESLRRFGEPFSVSEFKDLTGLSRKYAVPFLEWADRAGHTVRQGDVRRLR